MRLSAIAAAFVLSGTLLDGRAIGATFVYVSNADDGDIGLYTLADDGSLKPGDRFKAEKAVMPMAISPDKRFLVAAVRSKPYGAYTYAIDRVSGSLKLVGKGPLAESFPYVSFDRTGRFLLAAAYGAGLVSVSPVGKDGLVGEPRQVMPTGRKAHSILADLTGRYVFAAHLGTDQVFQFLFNAKSGRLAANTPPVLQLKAGTGPRHLIVSSDNRFFYLLSELTGTVTTLALDAKTGTLSETSSASMLPTDSKLVPGVPRDGMAAVDAKQSPRDMSADIWASDLHLTPDGKFLYAAERTSTAIAAFSVDAKTGVLTYLHSTPTEKQPRSFAIDPSGRFLIASGEKSDTITSYAIEPDGRLKEIGKVPTGKKSSWVEIVGF